MLRNFGWFWNWVSPNQTRPSEMADPNPLNITKPSIAIQENHFGATMEVVVDEEAAHLPGQRARHIKKRALKNKALSVSFDEKDLRDYVGGFHKRKKKRRKEAEQNLQEAHRRKRIEARKKRKLEIEFAYGGAPPATDSGPDECGEDDEQDKGSEPVTSISGTTTYDNDDMKVTVTTCEISREEDKLPSEKTQAAVPKSTGEAAKKRNIPVSKKKPFKRVAKHRSQSKLQDKRDKKKGKKNNKRMR